MENGLSPSSELAAQAVEVCLCFHTRKASRAITQVFDHILAPTGLKATQLSLLMVVSAREPLRIGDLADALVSDSTTVSRTIKPLIKAGLIQDSTDSQDRRIKRISLSSSGHAALERALPLWQDAQSHIAKQLGGSTVQTLLPALESAAKLGPTDERKL
jgi:DNA-binding MarR family transcriptional regulator